MTLPLPGFDPTTDLRIVGLYVSPGHNYFGHHGQPAGQSPNESVDAIDCVTGKGIRGDRFFDYKPDYRGQVTFFAAETWKRLCADFNVHDRDVAVFRRNIITRGVDLNALIDLEFTVQGIRFFGSGEAKPCHWMNEAFASGAEDALKGYGGLRARVLTDGRLRRDA
jgi:MOSC domain-containing protein YiiM